MARTHNQSIGSLYGQMWYWHYHNQLLKISVNRASTAHQQSVNRALTECQQFCWVSAGYTATHCMALVLKWVFNGQSFQYFSVYSFTNLHARSRRSYFLLPPGCTVKPWKPAFYLTTTLLLMISQVELLSFQIRTAMVDLKSWTTLLLEVMISSKNEHIFIRDLSDLALQIICDSRWASMNVGSKRSIGWSYSRHAALWC